VSSPWGGILRAATLLLVLEAVAQAASLGKQVLIAAGFGTTPAMDGYLVAFSIAALIRAFVQLPIKQTVIPMFRHDLAQRGEPAAWANLSVVLNNLGLILLGLAALVALVAPVLVDLVAPGLDDASEGLSSWLVRILVLGLIFAGLQGMLAQIFFSYRRFLLPGVAGAVDSLVVIGVLLLLAGRLGITGLAVAVVAGSAAQFLLLVPILWQKRRLYTPRVSLRHPQMMEMGRLSLPLLLSSGGAELARVTDRFFASLLAAGSLSALSFAFRLAAAANNLFIDSLQQATFPHFTQLSAEEKFASLSRQLFRYLRMILFLALPLGTGLMVLGDLIVRVVYQRGAFDETSVRLTSEALTFFALGLPALAATRLLSRTFFGLKDTRTPSKVAVVRLVVKVALCGALVVPLAHVGIALADAVSEILRALLLFVRLPAHVKRGEAPEMLRSLARGIAASASMGLLLVVVRQALPPLALPLQLLVLVPAGALIYVTLMRALGAEECHTVGKAFGMLSARLLPGRS
jgi:putative peptidoglycan lipid II flippase